MIRSKRTLIVMLLVLTVAASACQARPAATSQQASTATVTRGSLQATVAGAGTIAARAQVTLQFQNSGQIKAINVKIGDQVKAGQVLAALDTTELEAALASSQAGVDSAQAKLAAAKKGPLPAELKAAEASLASAQAALQAAVTKSARAGDQLIIEQETVDNAAQRLNDAQNAYSSLFEFVRSGATGRGAPFVPAAGQEWSSQKAALDNALVDYAVAVANYNLAAANVNDTSVQSAAAQVKQAQATLDNLKSTPAPEDVQAAELSLKTAQISLEQAKSNLRKSQIVAPFDGVVADVNVQVGQMSSANAQPIILVDRSRLESQVNISETDLPRIKVGETVQVTFDALSGQTFGGQVVKVPLVGAVTQGVVNYPVVIALDQADRQIRPGMTANVTIVVEQRDNILLVPNRAVKIVNRQRVATVVQDGAQTQVNVTLGMTGDSQSEVVSGLNEGDVVVVQQTTTTNQGGLGGGPGGFGGPPPGF